MSVTGSVTIKLGEVNDAYDQCRLDRCRLDVLERVPDGAAVIVDIGDRQFVSQDAAIWIHRHIERLHIRIDGTDPASVRSFVSAAQGGDWRVVA
jgi:hypothetical protein